MMNKAEKRKIEVETIANAYARVESYTDSYQCDIGYYEDAKKTFLEENPEAEDTSYYDNYIEENKVKLETINKVLEVIYKLM